ncbi:helix-turn-helix transcriptional regulator [Bacillus infantis]|uniref:helix-turn-helix transcriptional regulator n=1 Tax=Bacillus infantis TaxID=324767 RepID=UPI00321BEFD7
MMNPAKKREFLKKERKKRGLTQKEVAHLLEISRESYSLIERGLRDPGLGTAIKIADFYNINVRLFKT